MTQKLPKKIPIFPLSGVIFFPETNLPLNIFESRYLKMVDDSLKRDKFLGMIQSKELNGEVYEVGCLGKIYEHERTSDGRILINLKGISRFKIDKEIKNDEPYREFLVNYELYKNDTISRDDQIKNQTLDQLIENSKIFFKKQGIIINWRELSKLNIQKQIYTLAMISPFSATEKQKLLEIVSLDEIANSLKEITKFGFYGKSEDKNILH
tara:strand:- start:32 stop:661 length:630 start_codon:yes stop_codon:yes gene_type:complete